MYHSPLNGFIFHICNCNYSCTFTIASSHYKLHSPDTVHTYFMETQRHAVASTYPIVSITYIHI